MVKEIIVAKTTALPLAICRVIVIAIVVVVETNVLFCFVSQLGRRFAVCCRQQQFFSGVASRRVGGSVGIVVVVNVDVASKQASFCRGSQTTKPSNGVSRRRRPLNDVRRL